MTDGRVRRLRRGVCRCPVWWWRPWWPPWTRRRPLPPRTRRHAPGRWRCQTAPGVPMGATCPAAEAPGALLLPASDPVGHPFRFSPATHFGAAGRTGALGTEDKGITGGERGGVAACDRNRWPTSPKSALLSRHGWRRGGLLVGWRHDPNGNPPMPRSGPASSRTAPRTAAARPRSRRRLPPGPVCRQRIQCYRPGCLCAEPLTTLFEKPWRVGSRRALGAGRSVRAQHRDARHLTAGRPGSARRA